MTETAKRRCLFCYDRRCAGCDGPPKRRYRVTYRSTDPGCMPMYFHTRQASAEEAELAFWDAGDPDDHDWIVDGVALAET